MKKQIIAASLLLGFAVMGCKKNNPAADEQVARTPQAGTTICKGKPNPSINCLDVWRPVCGCDGVTYSNGCYANRAGVKSYTEGACDGSGGGTVRTK
jgi:hypothetical protein